MTPRIFAELVRTMRRDQIQRDNYRSPAGAMKARYSEKLVDDALEGMSKTVGSLPDLDAPTYFEVKP